MEDVSMTNFFVRKGEMQWLRWFGFFIEVVESNDQMNLDFLRKNTIIDD